MWNQIPGPSILMQAFSNTISLSLSLFLVKFDGRPRWEEGRRLAVWKETDWSGPKGYFCFYSPAHTGHVRYHTGHVRYTWAGPNYSKMCFLSSNPLFCYFLVQKGIWSWSKPSIITFLIQCHKLIFSFLRIWHKQDFAYLREIEWDNVDCGLKRAMSCVISRSNNQGEL